MKYRIDCICDLNKSSLTNKDRLNDILYLDTSSITMNRISELQTIKIIDAPSRAKRKVKDKTIIYSTVRPNLKHFGILTCPKENMVVSTGFTTIDVKKEFRNEINAEYLYYLLTNQSITDYLATKAESAVSSYPSINPSDIGELTFSFPEIKIQEAVVNSISPIDQKISLNTRMNAELEAMAKQLYDYWFVQFDFPDENGNPYKSSGGKMVYNSTLKREIPAGWEVKSLNQLAQTPKESINPFENPERDYKHYSIPAFDACGSYLVEKGEVIQSNKFIVNKGQILVPKLNPWYNRVILVDSNEYSICSTEFVILDAIEDYVKGFLFYTVKTDSFISYCTKGSTGTSHSQRRVPPEILKAYNVPYNKDVVSSFTACVMQQLSMINRNMNEIKQLTHLRDSLLPMLMNGQVTVE